MNVIEKLEGWSKSWVHYNAEWSIGNDKRVDGFRVSVSIFVGDREYEITKLSRSLDEALEMAMNDFKKLRINLCIN